MGRVVVCQHDAIKVGQIITAKGHVVADRAVLQWLSLLGYKLHGSEIVAKRGGGL